MIVAVAIGAMAYFGLAYVVSKLFLPKRMWPDFLKDEFDYSLSERVRKIDHARDSLLDAISAVDDLRRQADENQSALNFALAKLRAAENRKSALYSDINSLKTVASADVDSFRRIVGIPSRRAIWAERGMGFVIGVVASVVASYLYEFLRATIWVRDLM